MIIREEIVTYARSLLGRAYRPGVNTKNLALDCFGVVSCVAQNFGYTLPDAVTSGRPHSYQAAHTLACGSVDFVSSPEPGDFIMVNICRSPEAAGRVHFSLMTDTSVYPKGGMLWADSVSGQVIESAFDNRLLRRAHEFCRFRELSDG